ncbi:AsmA family protein [Candidatus Methylomirabilis sp.]|uniref:AsmA family protein n=1 Tax=Candidatus Methylomirabilis sp. TaxID=2032687 RepID=UPI002A5B2E7F|nr:AsmA family protein [Candidatus Methylomirabilis sp.]
MTGRGRRWLFGLLLVLGGLVIVLLAGPLLLDQERYRGILTSRTSQLLNRKVTASSLRVHLLPSPGVTIRDLLITDRAPWSGPFLEAERLDLALKLLPLLKGELQVRNVRIDRPRIRLAGGPDGWNLDDLIRPTAREAAVESRHTEGTRVARGQPALPVLVAGALTIRQGAIVLDNPLYPYGPARLELKDVNVDIPAPLPRSPIRIHANGPLLGGASGSFDLTGSIQPHEGDHPSIEVALHVRGLDVAQLASSFGALRSSPFAAALSGTLDLEGKAVGEWPRLDLETNVDLQRVGMALSRFTHAGTGGKENDKAPGDKAWLRAKGRWEGDGLDLSQVSLLWEGHTTTGRLHLATQKSPRIQFWLDTPDLSIESLVAIATAAAPVGATGQSPLRTADLVPSNDKGGVGGFRTPHSSEVGGLQVEGHLRSGVLRWGKLVLTAAEGDLRYCCGLLTIRQLHGGFYGGNLSGDAALSFSGRAPHVRVATHLEGIQTEPFLKAIQEPRWTLHGMMTLDSKMEFSGPLGPGALAKVSGQTDMAVTNGRIIGYTPLERLSKTVDPILKGVGIPPLTLNEFDRLSAHWTLDGGILRTRDLTLLRDGAKFYAVGGANLLNQTLDFDVTAKLAKTTLEAKVQGPSSDPVVTPQMGRIEGRIKTEVGKLLGKDRDKELEKVFKKLFSR